MFCNCYEFIISEISIENIYALPNNVVYKNLLHKTFLKNLRTAEQIRVIKLCVIKI